MADKNLIKNWFKTGLKPTQAQFLATWDSFWHKDEKIPITAIDDIENILNAKAEAEVLENHLNNEDAHPQLLIKARIIPFGQMLVFKIQPNENNNAKEPGDFCIGIVENQKIEGIYLGGDGASLAHYEISNYIQL
jgi:hypothetical protein